MKNLKLLIVFKVTALTMSSNLIFANDLTVRFRVAKTDQLLQTGSARAVGAAYHTSSIKQKNKPQRRIGIIWRDYSLYLEYTRYSEMGQANH